MPLRTGDSVSVSVNPTVRFTQYDSFKTMVTVRRELGERPEEDLKDLVDTIGDVYFRALRREIELYTGCVQGLGAHSSIEELLSYCRSQIREFKPAVVVEKKSPIVRKKI